MLKYRQKQAFTLSELLIVVAIVGILVAISIPVFASQREKRSGHGYSQENQVRTGFGL